MDRIFSRVKTDTQEFGGEIGIFVIEEIKKNREARDNFLMLLSGGSLQEYKELKRASIKELLLKIKNHVAQNGG